MTTLSLDFELALGSFELSIREDLPLAGITGIFGPSGAGKTSLLRVLAGLEPAARGRVALDGAVWQDETKYVPTHERGLGYVFQDGRLFPHLDVRANLSFASRQGRGRDRDRDRGLGRIGFDHVVAALDLGGLLDRDTTSLSGGERQRVAIGRALLASPRLLLMDEPASSLDLDRKREVVRMIEALPERFGLPVIYVTHDVDELVRLADEIVILRGGRVADRGPLRDVLERVDLSDSGESVETGAMIEGVVDAHTERMTEIAIGTQMLRIPRIEAAPGRRVRMRIHGRDVVVAVRRPDGLSIRNVLPAEIEGIETGESAHCRVRLRVGGQRLSAIITRDALDDLGLAAGQQVYALIKSVALDEYPLL